MRNDRRKLLQFLFMHTQEKELSIRFPAFPGSHSEQTNAGIQAKKKETKKTKQT